MDALCEDFGVFLRRQRVPMEKLEVSLYSGDEEVNLEFFEKILKVLGRQNPPIRLKVAEIRLIALPASQIMSILPNFDPKILKTMMICTANTSGDSIDAIFDTEQWKSLQICEIFNFVISDLKRISHFKSFNGKAKNVTLEDVEYLKEIFLHSSSFQRCKLMYETISDDWITRDPLISYNRHDHVTLKMIRKFSPCNEIM